MVKQVTGAEPLGVTVMNDRDVIIEFRPKVRLWEISSLMHDLRTWDKYKIKVTCLMSTKKQLIDHVKDRERARRTVSNYERKRQELLRESEENTEALRHRSEMLESENQEEKIKIQDLIDKLEDQVKRVECLSSSTSLPQPIDILTPRFSNTAAASAGNYCTPNLPTFSGILPVPKGEGSYEQFIFQVRGFRGNYSEDAVKSSMIGSVTDGARDHLDFVGFHNSLDVLIEALERRFGKGQTTDKIQQQFYQLMQERGETIQEFAGRIETIYKKLSVLYPGRYNPEILKERLFYGMTQHLRDSMRYLYKRPETTYDELLLTAKEAECEWLEHKTVRSKQTTTCDDTEKKEREEIKVRLDKLAETVKAASFQRKPQRDKKKQSPSGSQTSSPKSSPQHSPRSPGRGPAITAAGPFRNGKKPVQCWKCGGWGHFIRECATSENLDWRELIRADSSPEKEVGPVSTSSNNQ